MLLVAFVCAALQSDGDPSSLPAPLPSSARRGEVDLAVERGLLWLAAHQLEGGGFTGDVGHKQMDGFVVFDAEERQRRDNEGHPGVAGVAGLAFLADGHLPGRGSFSDVLGRTLDYLLSCQTDFGYIADSGTRMYSHAFATLFLSQIYGMAGPRQAEVASALLHAVQFIEQTQNQFGAWRYSPFTVEADLSVTVCQVQALRAARNAGIHVNSSTIDRVVDYLEESRIGSGRMAGAFYYKIFGRAARTKTSFTINSAAITSMHSAGLYDERLYATAVDSIQNQYAAISLRYPTHYFYWYGNYYAAQALFQEGGKTWERYWVRLRDDLLRRQCEDGRWENNVGPGDAFATGMACLLLRVQAQYLPVFQK